MKFKICLLGGEKVGKSSLLRRYAYNKYDGSYRENIGPSVIHKRVDQHEIYFWDCRGPDADAILNVITRDAHACIFVFDLTDENSFSKLKKQLEEYKYFPGFKFIVGTKDDLPKRFCSKKNLEEDCRRLGIPYFEVSANTGSYVLSFFEHVVTKIYENLPTLQINKKKQELISDLKSYIKRIEGYKEGGMINYTHGFWFFKKSRAVNREANYKLAQSLLENLEKPHTAIKSVFANITDQRNVIIARNVLNPIDNSNYVERGIHGGLKDIINKAQKYILTPKSKR